MATDFDQECFFIAPIGEDGTDTRNRSDAVRDWVVAPAAKEAAGLKTLRADDFGEPGQITAQAIQHCLKAKATVADLTGGNPNVYYELSVRHGALLPVVLIAEDETKSKLPFDLSQSRVIFFDHKDLASAGRAKAEIQKQIEASLTGTPDNPIYDGMRLAHLQAGNTEEQTLASVLDRLDRLSGTTEQIDRRLRQTEDQDPSRRWNTATRFVPSTRRPDFYTPGGYAPTPVIREWTTRNDDGTLELHRAADEVGPDGLTSGEKADIIAEQRREEEARVSPPSPDEED